MFLTSVRLLIISAMLLLTSCLTFPPPTPKELSKADYGDYPDNYEKIVLDYACKILKEPSSAKYTYVKGPKKTWIFQHTSYQYGWGVCYLISESNSVNILYFALINNGSVIESELDPYGPGYAHSLCDRLK
jgi:hypothetical protein